MGHEERFPPLNLSVGCGFNKQTLAGARGDDELAPISVIGADAALPCRSSMTCNLIVDGHNEVVIEFWV